MNRAFLLVEPLRYVHRQATSRDVTHILARYAENYPYKFRSVPTLCGRTMGTTRYSKPSVTVLPKPDVPRCAQCIERLDRYLVPRQAS